jgi:hypothetical protein
LSELTRSGKSHTSARLSTLPGGTEQAPSTTYRPNLLPSTIWLADGAVIVAGAL